MALIEAPQRLIVGYNDGQFALALNALIMQHQQRGLAQRFRIYLGL
jgi:hypothetical protein